MSFSFLFSFFHCGLWSEKCERGAERKKREGMESGDWGLGFGCWCGELAHLSWRVCDRWNVWVPDIVSDGWTTRRLMSFADAVAALRVIDSEQLLNN